MANFIRGKGKRPGIDPEVLALQALGYIASDDEALERFLAETGCAPSEIRERAGDKAFLGAILDFILSWEPRLLAFAQHAEIDPELVMAARSKLPGGERVW